jgi:curved DNA-binding protein CbpA
VSRVDYYAVLGVDEHASFDEIARAFRAGAKQLHPDTAADPQTIEQFKELSAAYAVLSDHDARRVYDESRPVPAPAPVPVPAPAAKSRRKPWSARTARTALIAGSVVAVLGLLAAYFTVHLRDADAAQRARYVAVTATRLDDGENNIAFTTRTGERVITKEPSQYGEGSSSGGTVGVRYDPANPEHVIVDAGTFGRDITLAIVAIKLFVGGLVFAILGARRLRKIRLCGSDRFPV